MKNSSLRVAALSFFRCNLFQLLLYTFFCCSAVAQLAVYPLRSGSANPPVGTTSIVASGVNALTLISGANMLQNSYNSTGYRIKLNSQPAWVTSITNGFGFDIPIGPQNGFDMNITGITVDVTYIDFDAGAGAFTIVPYFQVDAAGPWHPLAGPQSVSAISTVNFGTINETFYSGHNYVVRFYIYNGDGSTDAKNDEMRLANLVFNGITYQPPAQPVTVQTLSATASGKYTANASGSYNFNGTEFYLVGQSGFIWSAVSAADLATLDTSAANKTTNGSAGAINGPIMGLSAGTTYWIRAYIVTQFGIQYGTTLSFTTDAPTPPAVTTQPVTNVLSNKATGGGVITDSGGVAITSKGLVWNTAGSPTLTSNTGKVILNGGSSSFSDLMKQLLPNTRYCYRAFATNSVGTGYGNDVCFTTGAAVPVLSAIPGTIDFGSVFFGDNPITVSYILTGSNLTPGPGMITISIPPAAGFKISLTSGSGFSNSITIPYTGTSISRTPIFVQFPATAYGSFSGLITHSGGGVAAADADVVNVSGTVLQSLEEISNKGTDFYLGFGYEEKMSRKAGDADECRLSVYVTNPGSQAVRVHCDLTSGGYAQVTTIPAFGSYTFSGFPLGDPNNNTNAGNLPDARLFSTGISNKSIHVYTEQNIPVAVHMHSYTHSNSAAGAMVFPTNTWNSSYTVQAFGGISNNSNPNSFFFVIANEDNTEVTFTPTQPILDASGASLFNENQTTPANTLYAANGTYTVTLNRGQVFNAMGGFSPAGNGLDLSGTKVSTICDKKITVFGGNGRCVIQGTSCTSTSGSDHLIQQMFPSVAWGTKYLTVPTKNTAPNYFRIYFQGTTAPIVNINGTPATNLVSVNGIPVYYQYQSANPLAITSDKPISVSQFMLTPGCTSNTSIDAGPEMIILSPVEQAISNVVFFSPTSGKAIIDGSGSYTSYMNVIIPASKASTFKLDGVAPPAGSFTAHPQDAGYSYASLLVTSFTKHALIADTGFVAIAYGYGDGESYGFNAGTAVKNLTKVAIAENPQASDSSSVVIRTCINTPVTLKVAFPYLPSQVDSIVWYPDDPRVRPNVKSRGPLSSGTLTANGRTFYTYTSPQQYTFDAGGLYRFKVTIYGTFESDCPGEDQQTILVNAGQDILNLAANPTCNNPTVSFTADTIPMVGTHILNWKWDFGDNSAPVTTGTLSPQSHTFPTGGATAYTVKLSTTNTVGCISTDSLAIDFGGGLDANFTISSDAVCANVPVTFTDHSTGTGTSGSPNRWQWDFGDNSTVVDLPTSATQTHAYTTPGIKTVALTISTPIGCVKTFKDTVTVEATPVALIHVAPVAVCLGSNASYTDSSTISIGNIAEWSWTFDDNTTSNVQNPVHLWNTSGTHTAKLIVKSAGGCTAADTAVHIINVTPLPIAGFKYDLNCTTRTLTLTDTSNALGGTITGWSWDFGVPGATSSQQNPTYVYAASGTYIVTLSVTTAAGCTSLVASSVTITIAASPVADFTLPGTTCLPGASPAFVNNSTISDGTTLTYTWNFGDQTGDLQSPPLAASPTHVFPGTGPYSVSLTAISNKGCTNTIAKSYSAIYQPPVAVITAPAGVCLGNAANFSSASSTAPGSTVTAWQWNFGDAPVPGSATDQNPVYTYSGSGPRTVALTVTSGAGCTSAITSNQINVNLSPVASFTYSTLRCSDSVITFTDASVPNSTGGITEWTWKFGDGDSLRQTVAAPAIHTFDTAGSYVVSLSVKNADGCMSSSAYTTPVVINPNPISNFDVSDICIPGGQAQFTQRATVSRGLVTSWSWDFGIPGATSTLPTPTFNYPDGGVYQVSLKVTTDSSCSASVTLPVTAYNTPTTSFEVANTGNLCSNAPVSIVNKSTVTGFGTIDRLEIYWDYINNPAVKTTVNTPALNASFTNQYPVFGDQPSKNYSIRMLAYSGSGCSDDSTIIINLLAAPKVQFTQPSPVCQEAAAFDLTGGSDIFGLAGIGAYSGDGIDASPSFSPSLAGAGTHSIRYTYTATAGGCTDFQEKDIVVNPTPVVDFGTSQINILEGDDLQLAPSITNGSAYLWKPSTYLNSTTLATASGMPTDDIDYLLKVTSPKGCVSDSNVIRVKVVRNYVVPNTFTPNHDGNHDVFDIENLQFYPGVRVRIFNRSGQVVYETIGYDRPWDGTYKGSDMPFGTYYYVIETGGGRKPRTGYVTLIR